MEDFVTKLLETVTAANLWSTVAPIASLVGVLIVFKLGYNVVKKNINNTTKPTGKAMK